MMVKHATLDNDANRKMEIYFWLLISLASLAGQVRGEGPVTGITLELPVQTNFVFQQFPDRSAMFTCKVIIHNSTQDPLTVSNLFQDPAGLAMKVMDQDGREVSRLSAGPFHASVFTIPPGSNQWFVPYYGIMNRFYAPKSNTMFRLQLEGKLLGSGYTGSVTSNIVMLKVW